MTLEQYLEEACVLEASEIDKVKLIFFYFFTKKELDCFSVSDVFEWFDNIHLSKPNSSRLKSKIAASRAFVRGPSKDTFKLHASTIKALDSQFPDIKTKSESIVTDETVIPFDVYSQSRGYIKSLCDQVNASYHYNIFDGCAVLMRRLIEILLIHSFEETDSSEGIKDGNGNYIPLEQIVVKAKSSASLSLSRDTRGLLDTFRQLGNFSAHKIHYNCRRSDVDKIKMKYRAAIEELMYKSGNRT